MCKRLKDWYHGLSRADLITTVVIGAIGALVISVAATHGNTEYAQYGVITHIVDGDTIHIDSQRYRLAWSRCS